MLVAGEEQTERDGPGLWRSRAGCRPLAGPPAASRPALWIPEAACLQLCTSADDHECPGCAKWLRSLLFYAGPGKLGWGLLREARGGAGRAFRDVLQLEYMVGFRSRASMNIPLHTLSMPIAVLNLRRFLQDVRWMTTPFTSEYKARTKVRELVISSISRFKACVLLYA